MLILTFHRIFPAISADFEYTSNTAPQFIGNDFNSYYDEYELVSESGDIEYDHLTILEENTSGINLAKYQDLGQIVEICEIELNTKNKKIDNLHIMSDLDSEESGINSDSYSDQDQKETRKSRMSRSEICEDRERRIESWEYEKISDDIRKNKTETTPYQRYIFARNVQIVFNSSESVLFFTNHRNKEVSHVLLFNKLLTRENLIYLDSLGANNLLIQIEAMTYESNLLDVLKFGVGTSLEVKIKKMNIILIAFIRLNSYDILDLEFCTITFELFSLLIVSNTKELRIKCDEITDVPTQNTAIRARCSILRISCKEFVFQNRRTPNFVPQIGIFFEYDSYSIGISKSRYETESSKKYFFDKDTEKDPEMDCDSPEPINDSYEEGVYDEKITENEEKSTNEPHSNFYNAEKHYSSVVSHSISELAIDYSSLNLDRKFDKTLNQKACQGKTGHIICNEKIVKHSQKSSVYEKQDYGKEGNVESANLYDSFSFQSCSNEQKETPSHDYLFTSTPSTSESTSSDENVSSEFQINEKFIENKACQESCSCFDKYCADSQTTSENYKMADNKQLYHGKSFIFDCPMRFYPVMKEKIAFESLELNTRRIHSDFRPFLVSNRITLFLDTFERVEEISQIGSEIEHFSLEVKNPIRKNPEVLIKLLRKFKKLRSLKLSVYFTIE